MTDAVTRNGARLAQLERYLAEDPVNSALLADVFDEAIAAGRFDRATTHLQAAQEQGLENPGWISRAARLAIATGAWTHALEHLDRLHAKAGDHPAISHDVAFVRLRTGDFAACRSELEPWLRNAEPRGVDLHTLGPLQVLWLRATHHMGQLEEATDWAKEQLAQGTLHPAAAGVAALIAIDLGEFVLARQLLQPTIDTGSSVAEGLLARASIAIAERDHDAAVTVLRQALELNPEEGRTWATLGMANLQARDFAQARVQFARATALMPGHVGTWHGLGWTCLLLHDLPAALSAFQQALAMDPAFGESHGAVGLTLLLAGRRDEAEPHLERADRLDRHNVTSRYARALLAGRAQDRAALRDLAARLLDRPGVFRPRLSDEVDI